MFYIKRDPLVFIDLGNVLCARWLKKNQALVVWQAKQGCDDSIALEGKEHYDLYQRITSLPSIVHYGRYSVINLSHVSMIAQISKDSFEIHYLTAQGSKDVSKDVLTVKNPNFGHEVEAFFTGKALPMEKKWPYISEKNEKKAEPKEPQNK